MLDLIILSILLLIISFAWIYVMKEAIEDEDTLMFIYGLINLLIILGLIIIIYCSISGIIVD